MMDGTFFPAGTETDAGAGTLTVDLGAIADNYTTLRRGHPGEIAAVVKADAYGLGAEPIARVLDAAGCRTFFVAQASEGVALRRILADATIAVLHGVASGTEALCVAHALTPVLASTEQVARWAGRGPAMLMVDTGMHRLGVDAAQIAALPLANVTHVLSHLISSERADDPLNRTQLAAFRSILSLLPGMRGSLANSAAMFLGPDFAADLARPGAALYGINPTAGANPMRAVVTLTTPVLQVRDIPAGATVGYNATWRAARPTRVATAAVGYADGFSRAQSNRGSALFDGRPVPLIGRVSMDLATFDVTGCDMRAGDALTLIGSGRTVEDVADAAQTSAYEILCALGHRYARRYV